MARRTFDVMVSFVALLALGPLFVGIALAVKASSPGPVFYCQRRVGRGGRPFWLYKFRTMRVANGGPQVTAAGDDRITRVGAVLRRFKLDELPQFLNVLKGDMSLIGPRPEVERFVERYTAEQRRILEQTPGLAGLSALVYAHEPELLEGCADPEQVYVEHIMPRKIAVDLHYAAKRTFWSDLRLMADIALAILGYNRLLDRGYRLPASTNEVVGQVG